MNAHPPRSHRAHYHPCTVATKVVVQPTAHALLLTRVLLLATSIWGLCSFSGLRPLSCVIPTAFDCNFVDRFQYFGVLFAICIAWLHFACLQWGICGLYWLAVFAHRARVIVCLDATWVGVHPPRIIISWCKFAFWGSGCVCVFHLWLYFWGTFS